MALKDWKITQKYKNGKYIHWSHKKNMTGINVSQLASTYGKNANMWEVSIDYSGSSASEKRLKLFKTKLQALTYAREYMRKK